MSFSKKSQSFSLLAAALVLAGGLSACVSLTIAEKREVKTYEGQAFYQSTTSIWGTSTSSAQLNENGACIRETFTAEMNHSITHAMVPIDTRECFPAVIAREFARQHGACKPQKLNLAHSDPSWGSDDTTLSLDKDCLCMKEHVYHTQDNRTFGGADTTRSYGSISECRAFFGEKDSDLFIEIYRATRLKLDIGM